MGLRELVDCVGIAAVLGLLLVGLQLMEWGSAADHAEPPEVDSVEVPSAVDVRVQGGGVRPARARALALQRRLERRELEECGE